MNKNIEFSIKIGDYKSKRSIDILWNEILNNNIVDEYEECSAKDLRKSFVRFIKYNIFNSDIIDEMIEEIDRKSIITKEEI